VTFEKEKKGGRGGRASNHLGGREGFLINALKIEEK